MVLNYELDETRWFKGPEPTEQPAAPATAVETPLVGEETNGAGAADDARAEEPSSSSGGRGSGPQQDPPNPP